VPVTGAWLMGYGGGGGRSASRHCGWRMTASALGGIIRFQLIPDFLCECQAVIFVFCLCVEFSCQVSPELHGGRHVPHQPGQEGWRYVAVGAAGANTELIRVMHSMRKLLEWRIHFRGRKCKTRQSRRNEGRRKSLP